MTLGLLVEVLDESRLETPGSALRMKGEFRCEAQMPKLVPIAARASTSVEAGREFLHQRGLACGGFLLGFTLSLRRICGARGHPVNRRALTACASAAT